MRCLVLASSRVLAFSLLRCLKDMRASVTVLANRRYASIIVSNMQQRYLTYDDRFLSGDGMPLIDRIDRICARRKVDFVLAAGFPATLFLANHQHLIRQAQFFPLAEPELIATLHDKWQFAQFLTAHALPTPQTRLLSRPSDIDRLDIGYPLIVKPLGASGSEGVVRIESRILLEDAIMRLSQSGRLPIIAQEFIPGDDIGVGVVADHGRVIARTLQRPRSKGLTKMIENEGIDGIIREIVAITNFHGPANFDIRVDNRTGALSVLECNPRFWATIDVAMYCGINMPQIALNLAMGKEEQELAQPITHLLRPERAIAKLATRTLTWSQLTPGTQRAIQLDLTDPLAAAITTAELYWPRIKSKFQQRKNPLPAIRPTQPTISLTPPPSPTTLNPE